MPHANAIPSHPGKLRRYADVTQTANALNSESDPQTWDQRGGICGASC